MHSTAEPEAELVCSGKTPCNTGFDTMHTFQFGSELWQIWHCTDEAHRGWTLTCHFSLGLDGLAELEEEMGSGGGGGGGVIMLAAFVFITNLETSKNKTKKCVSCKM